MPLSDTTRLSIVQDIAKLSRPRYEDLLVQLELASLHSIREGNYAELQKRDLIFETIGDISRRNQLLQLLEALRARHILSEKTLRALGEDGIELQSPEQTNIPTSEAAYISPRAVEAKHKTASAVSVETEGDVSVDGDIVGRDKIVNVTNYYGSSNTG
jgi:hypothetical protein